MAGAASDALCARTSSAASDLLVEFLPSYSAYTRKKGPKTMIVPVRTNDDDRVVLCWPSTQEKNNDSTELTDIGL